MSKANQGASMPPMVKLSMLLSVLAFLGVMGTMIYSMVGTKKIAYVRSDELLNKYQGMIQAREAFKVKADSWQVRIDTLKNDFEGAMKAYEAALPKLNTKERTEKESRLRKQQEDLVRYTEAISKQAEEEDAKMTQGVLNQVNSLIELYGKNHGYDIIFGANGSGNIVYGVEAVDITNEVLVALNRDYEGS